MKQIIKLDKEDIAALVAKEFNVTEDKVVVYLEKVYRGYGMGEHKEYEVCVKVNI